jgi:hypothetical protein
LYISLPKIQWGDSNVAPFVFGGFAVDSIADLDDNPMPRHAEANQQDLGLESTSILDQAIKAPRHDAWWKLPRQAFFSITKQTESQPFALSIDQK